MLDQDDYDLVSEKIFKKKFESMFFNYEKA